MPLDPDDPALDAALALIDDEFDTDPAVPTAPDPASSVAPATSAATPAVPVSAPGNPPVAPTAPAAPVNNPSQGGPVMADLAAFASMIAGPSKADKLKDAVKAFSNVASATETEIPGVSVVVILDGKVVSGDVEESIRGLYLYIVGENGVALAADDASLFIGLCVAVFGDNDAVRKSAKAVFDKKGA